MGMFQAGNLAIRVVVGLALAGAGAAVLAQQVAVAAPALKPPANRWQSNLEAFAADDLAHKPVPGGVLFVGSSSIRLWDNLSTQFKDLPVVVNRGFGGSGMADCTKYLQQLVIPHKPRLVVVYAGENDLAEGRSPEQVLEALKGFVDGVRKELPQTRIAYVSIKPSPLRAALMPAIQQTNAGISAYAKTADVDFIDVHTPMLNGDGSVREELFRADRLHLNAAGYALWKTVIASHVH